MPCIPRYSPLPCVVYLLFEVVFYMLASYMALRGLSTSTRLVIFQQDDVIHTEQTNGYFRIPTVEANKCDQQMSPRNKLGLILCARFPSSSTPLLSAQVMVVSSVAYDCFLLRSPHSTPNKSGYAIVILGYRFRKECATKFSVFLFSYTDVKPG